MSNTVTDTALSIVKDVHETIDRLNDHFGRVVIDKESYEIRFDLKGTTAGQASRSHANFNLQLAHENRDSYKSTVVHEVCHSFVGRVYPSGSPHGKEWKYLMMICGVVPERTHDYDVSSVARKRKQYLYRCPNCGESHVVSSIIHNRIMKGRKYSCGYCRIGSNIKLVKQI